MWHYELVELRKIVKICKSKPPPHLRLLKTLRILKVFFIGCLENLTVGQICQYTTMLTSLKIILSHDFVFQPPMIDSKHWVIVYYQDILLRLGDCTFPVWSSGRKNLANKGVYKSGPGRTSPVYISGDYCIPLQYQPFACPVIKEHCTPCEI